MRAFSVTSEDNIHRQAAAVLSGPPTRRGASSLNKRLGDATMLDGPMNSSLKKSLLFWTILIVVGVVIFWMSST